ncbi:MAG: EscV/YscV/HrcV family type III secretion system export apparatus protein, partial [Pseudomonadota bacterium]
MSDITAGNAGVPAPKAASETGVQAGVAPRLGGGGKLGELIDYARRADIMLAIGVMTILVILIMPLPAILLDVFLAVSIILSV